MALYKRDFHSFSTIQEHAPQGWNWCMSKAYCKWPVIIAIIIAIVFAIFTVYCCLRCCGCFRLGRRGGRRRANTQPFAGFNPLAYQGYAPAGAPAPGYGPPEPPRYAQFDNTSNRKINEDSLPAMPTWSQGQDRKVPTEAEEEGEHGAPGRDVEMGHIEKKGLMNNASTVDLAPPVAHQRQNSYTGPDFDAVDTSYGGAAHHDASPYTGPDFSKPTNQYSPYQPLPAHGRTATQDMGTTYGNTQPPSSPTLHSGFATGPPPSVLQAGRRPEGGFRDV